MKIQNSQIYNHKEERYEEKLIQPFCNFLFTLFKLQDRLLTRVEILESQLSTYGKGVTDDKLREEAIRLMEEKEKYQVSTFIDKNRQIYTVMQFKFSFIIKQAFAEVQILTCLRTSKIIFQLSLRSEPTLQDMYENHFYRVDSDIRNIFVLPFLQTNPFIMSLSHN